MRDPVKKTGKRLAARIICPVLAVLLLIPALASCGKYAKVPSTDEEKQTVMTVGGYSVAYDMYRYFYLHYKSGYTDADFAADKLAQTEAALREKCISALRGVYATLSLSAEYGITAEDSDIAEAVSADVEEMIDSYGSRSEYLAALKENNITDSIARFFLEADACEDKLYSTLTEGLGILPTEDTEILAAIKGDEFVRVILIYIQNDDGEDTEENRKRAEQALAKAKAGVDFDTLIGDYSEDYSMTSDGYYFTHGEMLEEIEDAAFALSVGELSPVVETYSGFYVLKRLDKLSSYITKNYDTLKAQYLSSLFYRMLDTRKGELTVVTNEFFDTLGYDTIK